MIPLASQEEATRVTPRECGPASAGWLRGRVALAIRTLFLRRSPRLITYPGIRLRISTPSGVVLEVDSSALHHLGILSGEQGWYDLIAGGPDGTMEFSTVPLKIEVKPIVELLDA